jgi:putative membrane protein
MYNWVLAFHVVSIVCWIASLAAVLALLQAHPNVEEKSRAVLTTFERRLAIVMDIGATAAIACGLYLAFNPINEFKHGAWLHVKLTAVVVGVLTTHGMARVKIKRFRNGDMRPVPGAMWVLLIAGVATAAIFGANQTLLR